MKKIILIGIVCFLVGAALSSGIFLTTQYEGTFTDDGYVIESTQFWHGFNEGYDASQDAHRQDFEIDVNLYLEEQLSHWGDQPGTPEEVIRQLQHGIAEGDYIFFEDDMSYE